MVRQSRSKNFGCSEFGMRALRCINQRSIFKVVSLMLVILSIMLSQPGMAASLNKDDVKNLDSLEMRFFEHTYKSDSSESRIERLEKFVFGEAKQGDEESRLEDLVASLPKPDPAESASAAQDNSAAADTSQSDADQQPQQTAASDNEDTSEDYPKIDAMEQLLLGKTFKGAPVAKRLDQLEIKAFKQASSDPDLSDRVTRLSDYVEKRMHKSVDQLVDPRNVLHYNSPGDDNSNNSVRAPAYTSYGSGGGQGYPSGSYGMAPALAGGASQDYWAPPSMATPDDAQVAWLENHVFGRSFANAPLLDRLKRLDAAVFPSEPVDTTASIPMQIKVLVNAVELMHNSHPGQNVLAPQQVAQQAPEQGAGGGFPSWPPQGAQQQQNQYANYTANAAGQNTGTYPYQNGYADTNSQYNQPIQNPQAQQQQQQQEDQQRHGHPLLKGLAHALLSVGTMAASSAMMSGMGGMGGYGYGYGGGGYSGMMPGYGGIPGIHF